MEECVKNAASVIFLLAHQVTTYLKALLNAMRDKGRLADIEYLLRVIQNPYSSSGQRREAEESLKAISNENGLTRSMRERLIKETRAGRTANVRDITEYVHSKGHRMKYGIYG